MRTWRIRTMAAALAVAALAQGTATATAGRKPADIPVRTYASDTVGNAAFYTIQSDALGAYVNGNDGVVSVLMANVYNNLYNGDWELDASASNVRRLAITLGPENAAGITEAGYTVPPKPPFWGTSLVGARVIDKCTEFGSSLLTMVPGASITCPVLVRWGSYRLDMGAPIEAPESTPGRITCNRADTVGCTDWFIDPVPAVAADGVTTPGAIARLVSIAKNGAVTNLGDFYMTFHFHVTRP